MDKVVNMVRDADGNLYNSGFNMNLVTQWGADLETTVTERGVAPQNAGNDAEKSHMYVAKLAAAAEAVPACLASCEGSTDRAVVDAASCFIDGRCYAAGDDGRAFGKSCFVCDQRPSRGSGRRVPRLGRRSAS